MALSACGGGSSGTSASSSSGASTGAANTDTGTGSANVGTGSQSATVSWSAPSQNIDGSALTDLAGYTVYYGVDANDLSDSVEVEASNTSYTMNGLVSGTTYYFAVAARNSAGAESEKSEVVDTTA